MRDYYYEVFIHYIHTNEHRYIYYKNYEDAKSMYDFIKNAAIRIKSQIVYINEATERCSFCTEDWEAGIERHIDRGLVKMM